MKILIVGGAGEVGRYLTKSLSQQGHDVTVLNRAPRPPEWERSLTLNYLQGNIADPVLAKETVQGKDVIIHLAWSFSDDPPTVFNEDIKGHIHLLEAASSSTKSHFIYTSTATVYGRAAFHPVTEDHPCLVGEARKPLYALGKYAAEELCKLYNKEKGLSVMIFRFWWAFGENIGGRHLRDLVRKALNHEPLEMVRGAGGTFVTMADLGRVVKSAIATTASTPQVYNVGSLFLTWEEIGSMIVHLTHSNSPIHVVPPEQWKGPAFLNEIWDLRWDKAKHDLGYEPEHPDQTMRSLFAQALQTCISQTKGN